MAIPACLTPRGAGLRQEWANLAIGRRHWHGRSWANLPAGLLGNVAAARAVPSRRRVLVSPDQFGLCGPRLRWRLGRRAIRGHWRGRVAVALLPAGLIPKTLRLSRRSLPYLTVRGGCRRKESSQYGPGINGPANSGGGSDTARASTGGRPPWV